MKYITTIPNEDSNQVPVSIPLHAIQYWYELEDHVTSVIISDKVLMESNESREQFEQRLNDIIKCNPNHFPSE